MEYNEDLTNRTISIVIDGRTYKMSVRRGDEEREALLRKSAELMNTLIEKKRRESVGILTDDRDIIILALLNYVFRSSSNEINLSKRNEQLENSILEIKNLNFKLEEIIKSLDELKIEE